jgi:Concanavalin A-like lectin/glucanases superfamily/FG-GAP repeat
MSLARLGVVGAVALAMVGVTVQVGAPRAAAAVTPGCVVDTTGVIGWWRGQNDLTAVTGPDLVGTAQHVSGPVGAALSLDGSSIVETNALPAVSTGVTVEMWVKPATTAFTGLTQVLASRWDFPGTDDSARSFELLYDPYGNLVWSTDESGAQRPFELRVAAPQFLDGAFHHVAATWDQTTAQLFIDGVVAGSAPSQKGVLNAASSTNFRLGSRAGIGSPLAFVGAIDEPTVWSRALLPIEVAAVRNAGITGKCSFGPVQQAKVSGASAANDRFGSAVGISGTTIVTGAPLSSLRSVFGGAAYVSTLQGASWVPEATLLAADGTANDNFGSAVDIEGDTIVVAAPFSDTAGLLERGAVYVFTRSGTLWTQQAKLLAADAATSDRFGFSVDLQGDTVVVGAPFDDIGPNGDTGSAYVFVRTGTSWAQQAKITPSDPAAGDNFGLAVGLDGDSVVVGSPNDDDVFANAGSAYAYVRTGAIWTEEAKLLPLDTAAGDSFGSSVAMKGAVAVIGAPLDDDLGLDSGSASVVSRSGTMWGQWVKLTAFDGSAGDRFGLDVALDGVSLVVGAPSDSPAGVESGSAYVFEPALPNWTPLSKVVAADGASGDQFGSAVAVSGSVVVGAPLDDNPGNNNGSLYVFVS